MDTQLDAVYDGTESNALSAEQRAQIDEQLSGIREKGQELQVQLEDIDTKLEGAQSLAEKTGLTKEKIRRYRTK